MGKKMRIHHALVLAGASAVFVAGVAQAQAVAQGTIPAVPPAQAIRAGEQASQLDRSDRKALAEMAEANMAEIAHGRIALAKAVNPEVRAYAQRMVDEHTTALAEVQAVAQAKGVELPKELTVRHKAKGAMLEALKGDIFDRTYIKQSGRRDHRVTSEKLRESMNKIQDPDVKALAMKLQPIVEQHLLAADELIAQTARGATGTAGTPGDDTSTASGKEPIPNKK